MSARARWILAIVGLLGGNLVAMAVLMGAAHSGDDLERMGLVHGGGGWREVRGVA